MNTSLVRVTGPTLTSFTTGTLAHLRMSAGDDDTGVAAALASAFDACEDYCEVAFGAQSWRLAMDDWPTDEIIRLERPPVTAVTTVKYNDENGVQQTLANTAYLLDADAEPATLTPVYGTAWPTLRSGPAAVQVVFATGYGTIPLPARALAAVMLTAASHYENRDGSGKDIPPAATALLDRLRWRQ